MANAKLAAQIADDLGLDLPPVALAFHDTAPAGVAVTDDIVPSACAFWRKAEAGVFFAPVARHANCPIGAFVMGFELGDALMAELQSLIGQMTACGYVHRDEPAKIPVNRRKAAGILYGPLAAFPGEPDAVLVWLTPTQAMIWSEATGGAAWTGSPPTNVFGRPACAAIPADRMLAVIPGPRLADFAKAIAATTGVNRAMRQFYEDRLAALRAKS